MCGRTAVAEISACLRSRLSSCITVSARGFAGVQQLTFKLDEVDRSTKGSFPCSVLTSVGRECGRFCSHGTWEVSCCLQEHLYFSEVPPSACKGRGCSQCSLLSSWIHDFGVKPTFLQTFLWCWEFAGHYSAWHFA